MALIAVGLAAFSATATRKQLRILLDDKRKEQAAKIAVWVFLDEKHGNLQFRLSNTSNLPIYMVELWVRIYGDSAPTNAQHLPFAPAGDSTIPVPKTGNLPVGESDTLFAGIAFRDAAGRRWRRDAGGALAQIGKIEFDEIAKRSADGR